MDFLEICTAKTGYNSKGQYIHGLTAINLALHEVLEGYRDLDEARLDAEFLGKIDGIRFTVTGYKVDSTTLSDAIEIKEALQ